MKKTYTELGKKVYDYKRDRSTWNGKSWDCDSKQSGKDIGAKKVKESAMLSS